MARIQPPISNVLGNLVFGRRGDDVWAVYRVRCRSYQAEPVRRKAGLVGELHNFAHSAEADFQILRVAQPFDAEEYARRLLDATPWRAHGDLWRDYVEAQRRSLAGLEAHAPALFLCVRLSDPSQDLQERATRLFERTPREIIRSIQGRRGYEEVSERERIMSARVTSCLDARPATAEEIQWLIRRSLSRGAGEPPRSAVADGSVYRWLSEVSVDHGIRRIHLSGERGESYQVGLCLGEVDHAPPFSRQVELMFTPLEEHPWPIDAALSVRFVRNDQAKRQLYHQFARKAHQLHEEEQSLHGAMDDSHQRVVLSHEYHGRLSATGEPMLMGTLSFLVAAGTEGELAQRVQSLREAFPWPLYRPYGDQLDVWLSHLPGQRCRVGGFERPFTPEQIGAMVPHATHEAGSETRLAVYLGTTIHGSQPTFFDLREGSETNRSSVIALLGSQGGGKTATLQLLQYQAFLQGARIVDIDPKGDHRLHLIPEVAPHTRVIKLGPSEEHAGKLDPLRVAPEDERHDAASTFLIDVLPPVDADVQAAISGAITRVIAAHGRRACCREVIAELERGEREEERKAGYLLSQYQDAGIVRLGFAKLDDPIPSRVEEQVTYLQIRALKRAAIDTVRSEMSQAQRHGRAILQLVALYAMKILGTERERLKVLSFDEASFLTQDAVGSQLLETLNRWGRSELATSLISSQILDDYVGLANLIGHWFLFAMRDPQHARRSLAGLELDDSSQLAADLCERYGEGRCLYRDLSGRAEPIQVDLGGLAEALSTRPGEDLPESAESPESAEMDLEEEGVPA